MIDFTGHIRWIIGALAIYGLVCLSVGLTFGALFAHAVAH